MSLRNDFMMTSASKCQEGRTKTKENDERNIKFYHLNDTLIDCTIKRYYRSRYNRYRSRYRYMDA